MKSKNISYLTQAAMIAALYVILTQLAHLFGLDSQAIQLRFSEAVTILPFFTPAAIPGLFVGCILANFFSGCLPWDIVFGSLATLLGALGTYALRKNKWLAPLPPILSNTLIVPFVLSYVYHLPGSIPYFMLTVGAGEVLSCAVLGLPFLLSLERYGKHLFYREFSTPCNK